ncbi:DEAD/DEAH box helicase [bacterium]|nr:DEAD/DEAH box helicase [bacterium]
MTQTDTPVDSKFTGLGIAPKVMELLNHLKFHTPTPIQEQSIPVGLEGKDIIGIAQTGTGKTLAFSIPLVQRLQQLPGRALVLVPTRELAIQVNDTMKLLAKPMGLTSVVLIGGESMNRQVDDLKRYKPRIIIATPGRLLDHMQEGTISLADIELLVLDEADRMLDMGFAPQVNRILKSVVRKKQTFVFSATMPEGIVNITKNFMSLPVRVEVARAGTTAEKVEQEIIMVDREGKMPILDDILKKHVGTVLIFSRTKHGAHRIKRILIQKGYSAAEIHADRSLGQRKEALEGFKTGKYRILVATDIAARGIDVSHIELVVNYDLPGNSEDYVHRIGRTGRAGRAGKAISFATPDEKRDIKDIERVIKQTLSITPMHREALSLQLPSTVGGNANAGMDKRKMILNDINRERLKPGRRRFSRR